MKSIGATTCLLLAFSTATPRAQVTSPATERYYVNVSAGVALTSGDISGTVSRELYDEMASVTFRAPRSSSSLADATGGIRLGGDIYAGLSVSQMATRGNGRYVASIPDPVFFNRPLLVEGTLEGVRHRAIIYSPHFTWSAALTDRFDITTSLGLAIARLTQDVASGLTVSPGTQAFTVGMTEERAIGLGPFLNVDLIYNLRTRWGVGWFVRYAGATADLPSAKVKAGGLQSAAGLRLRF